MVESSSKGKPRQNYRSILTIGLVVVIGVSLIGCTAMIYTSTLKKFPTYEEVEEQWPPLEHTTGRVVVYWPRLPMAGFSPVGTGGFAIATLTVDDSLSTKIGDKTFVFTDLATGSHSIEVDPSGLLFPPKRITIEVSAGEITFVKITNVQLESNPPVVVLPADARLELVEIHHNYKEALPFPDQPRRAKRVV